MSGKEKCFVCYSYDCKLPPTIAAHAKPTEVELLRKENIRLLRVIEVQMEALDELSLSKNSQEDSDFAFNMKEKAYRILSCGEQGEEK